VGNSLVIEALRTQIRHLAAFDTVGSALVPTLLLQGETGTGKGLVARVIHDSGPRAQGPFVDINCAAIPETLLEVELFGVEAGTFTDAKRTKPGLVESASHGTLFLDEIDALPLLLQAKLLSVVEEKRVRRLGAVESRHLDVKFIAATPTDLSVRVTEGHFRPDLYHRLAVVLLAIPPLRERGEDILLLAQHFVRQYAEAYGLPPKPLSRDAEAWLLGHSWSGNVRELSHLMERVVLLGPQVVVTASTLEQLCLPRPYRVGLSGVSLASGEAEPLDELTRMRQALSQTGGNVVQAARLLGISRGALRYWMRRYSIGRPNLQVSIPPQSSQEQEAIRPCKTDHAHSTSGESRTLEAAWEQKPVVVLVIDVTWPEAVDHRAQHVEPWTLATRWQQTLAKTLRGFGGYIVQHASAPLTIIFGIPQTLEQMPQRAVQAALAIRHYVAEGRAADSGRPCPEVRMAIHLGQGLVDVHAGDPTSRLLPLGEMLSLPVRLLGYAAPGDILLSPQVGCLVEGWLELQEREGPAGTRNIDGSRAYAVEGLRSRCSPLAVYGKRHLSRFVGRERELGDLRDILAQVAQGCGQLVGIVGEPGVGKSRLCYELTRAQRHHKWLMLESSPVAYGKDTPYLPILDLLKAYFRLDARDEQRTIREKVMGKLRALDERLMPTLPAMLMLLDVSADDPQWQALDPPQRRQRLLEACKRLLLRASQVQPLLLVVENLHWIDTETQAFLDNLVDSLPSARIVLLVNYRPEYQHSWGSKTYYTQLRLDPLPPTHARGLLHGLLGKHPVLAPLIQLLITRTAGNPFFLEESVRTLVETGMLVGEWGAYHLAQGLLTMQMPATVQAVLAARIDRLPPTEKHLLHTAAVIGAEVPLPLLQAIAELPEAAVHEGLLHLQSAEFLYETRFFPEHAYTFKHALTHEVAYSTLLPERRCALHARIVEALEAIIGDRGAEQVDRLAYHALRGEMWDKALAYCRQAGEMAIARSAYREARGYFEQALIASQRLPAQRDVLAQGIDLRLSLDRVLLWLGDRKRGFDYLREAAVLAKELDDPRLLGRLATAFTHYYWRMGDCDAASEYGQRALVYATARGDTFEQARANGMLGTIYFSLGQYRCATDMFKRSVVALTGDLRHVRSGPIIDSVRSRSWLMHCLAEIGAFPEGIAYGEEAIKIAEAAEHLSSAIFAQSRLGRLLVCQGDLSQAIAILERALADCRANDLVFYLHGVALRLGLAYALSGRITEALPLFAQVVDQEMGGTQEEAPLLKGEGYFLAGNLEEASACAEQVLTLARTHKTRGNEAWSLRLLGAIALHSHSPDHTLGETYYRQALTLADELGMRPLQAHCHSGLGTLYTQTGRREQARTELSAAIELYRTMQMTFWLPSTSLGLQAL
jgi:transcriptional regulator with AAA-type ATPase domain/tetratricopeptide (TPR) repeat protein/class 3 adenylate cyclase